MDRLSVKNDIKEAFLKYIGPEDSLAGYQKSYKLVLYKVFFTRVRKKFDTTCDAIAADFQQYYVQRKNKGLIPDIDTDAVIANIEASTKTQVLSLILRNPFKVISQHQCH